MRRVRDVIRKLQVNRATGRLAEIGRLYSAAELAAIRREIVSAFESMAESHAPGCAVVGLIDRDSPRAITVIPANSDAAEIRVEFRQTDRTTMVVHMGAYGEIQGWEGINAKYSLLSAAKNLFQLVLEGRYREEVWVNVKSGRYEGGQSYLMDSARHWHAVGTLREPRIPFGRLRFQDERFAPY